MKRTRRSALGGIENDPRSKKGVEVEERSFDKGNKDS